jgi:isocitrate dehydrogenase (NAD+)
MKLTSGLFLNTGKEIATEYSDIEFKEMIVDNACMQLVLKPEQFDVVVTTNMFGDILSDLMAGLVGGLGVVPGANIGKDLAVFEAVHGTAPDIAGQGKANPTALLLSGLMMLRYMQLNSHADRIETALFATLKNKTNCTADLGGACTTQQFTQNIIAALPVTAK